MGRFARLAVVGSLVCLAACSAPPLGSDGGAIGLEATGGGAGGAGGGGDGGGGSPGAVSAPVILQQPTDVHVILGATASFSVTVEANPAPTYAWKRGGQTIPGATGAAYVTPASKLSDDGASFTVEVTNTVGTIVSRSASLSVNAPPEPAAPQIDVIGTIAGTSQVSANDPNATQTHTYAVTTAPGHGTATVNESGLVTYVASAGYAGADSLVVTVTDSGTPAQTGTVTIGVAVEPTSPPTLVVTPSSDPIWNGGVLTYEARVSNPNGAPLSNVVLSTVVPHLTTMLGGTITGGGACPAGSGNCGEGSSVTWPRMTLAAGETKTVWFAVQLGNIADGTSLHCETRLAYPGGLLTKALDTTVKSTAGLWVWMAEDRDPVGPGAALTYAVTVGNTAAQAQPTSTGGVLRATVPAGTSFVSATGGGTLVNGKVEWQLGSVAASGSTHVSYTVTVGSTAPSGTVLEAGAEMLDGSSSLARAWVATEVRTPVPLTLTVTPSADPIWNGGVLTYEARVSNVSGAPVNNVVLSTVVPRLTTMLGASITGGGACPASSGNCGEASIVAWSPMSLAAGETKTVWFALQLGNIADGWTIHTETRLAHPTGLLTKAVDTTVKSPAGLWVWMAEDRDPVEPGAALTYAVTVGNTAAQAQPTSAGGVLRATVPAGTSFVSATGGGTLVSGKVEWQLGSVAASNATRLSYTVTVGSTVPGGTVLEAVAEMLDGSLSLARGRVATEVRTPVPLTLTVSATPDPVANGAQLSYQVAVKNVSGAGVSNVVLTTVVPRLTTMLGATITGGGACPVGNGNCGEANIVAWSPISLAAGETKTVAFSLQLGNIANGWIIRGEIRLAHPQGVLSRSLDVVVHN